MTRWRKCWEEGDMITTDGVSKTVQLKVYEAYVRDVGRGIARIDYDTMEKLVTSRL
jgi:hypothetical protein